MGQVAIGTCILYIGCRFFYVFVNWPQPRGDSALMREVLALLEFLLEAGEILLW